MFSRLADYIEKNALTCTYKRFTGLECTGCGIQRSAIALLRGEIIESLKYYPALIPIIVMLVYLLAHLFLKFKKGARVLLVMFIINAAIILTHYFLKMYHLFNN